MEEQNRELQRRNEALAGQVYRVHHLQEQVERQQQIIRDLEARLKQIRSQDLPTPNSALKVTPITQAKAAQIGDLIQETLRSSGVELTPALNRVIRQHDENVVLQAIQAYNQYTETNQVTKPGACLRRAIEEGWVPNEKSEPSTPEQDEFDRFYADAVAQGFLVDVPKNHLPTQGGEILVKVNQSSPYGPWTSMPWRQAKVEYEGQR